jgi:hypothetical protein
MVRFSFYEPAPVVNQKTIVVNNELNESVEVEVGACTFESECDGSSFPESYSGMTGSVMRSYDSDERTMYDDFSVLEGSGNIFSADMVKECNVKKNDTLETVTTGTLPSLEEEIENPADDADEMASGKSGEEIGSVVTEYLQGEIASFTEDEVPRDECIKDECIVEKDASSEVQEVNFINATDGGDIADECVVAVDADVESEEPKIKGIADECVVVIDANIEYQDATKNVGECRTVASSGDKLSEMMRDRIQAINGIRGLLEREQEQGKSSHHAEELIVVSIFRLTLLIAITPQRLM